MKQVVCLSTSNFYPFPTRKQNIMTRLSDADILYFDPPVSLLAPLKDRSSFNRLFAYRKEPSLAQDNLLVYSLPPVLPFFNKYRWINKLNQWHLARFVRKKMKKHGFDQPYLWCYSPTSCDIVDRIPHRELIYDCVDRHSAYKGMINPSVVDKQEQDLAGKCDYVFCTAQGLYETLKQYNEQTFLIPNGAAYELFSQAAVEAPASQQAVFGFVGMLQDCIAYDYIAALAKAYPDARIELIGKKLPDVDLSEIENLPNIYLRGLLPQKELPAVMKDFNVCLNLFSAGRLSKDVSPLKFYEYLATGKPLVSTREPLQVSDYAEMVYIADSIPEFLECCKKALEENDPLLREKRMQAGKAASWSNRVEQMEKILSWR